MPTTIAIPVEGASFWSKLRYLRRLFGVWEVYTPEGYVPVPEHRKHNWTRRGWNKRITHWSELSDDQCDVWAFIAEYGSEGVSTKQLYKEFGIDDRNRTQDFINRCLTPMVRIGWLSKPKKGQYAAIEK